MHCNASFDDLGRTRRACKCLDGPRSSWSESPSKGDSVNEAYTKHPYAIDSLTKADPKIACSMHNYIVTLAQVILLEGFWTSEVDWIRLDPNCFMSTYLLNLWSNHINANKLYSWLQTIMMWLMPIKVMVNMLMMMMMLMTRRTRSRSG